MNIYSVVYILFLEEGVFRGKTWVMKMQRLFQRQGFF